MTLQAKRRVAAVLMMAAVVTTGITAAGTPALAADKKAAAPAAPAPGTAAAVQANIPKATLGWDKLADVKEVHSMDNGLLRVRAAFGPEVQALEGKPLTIAGFIIPLEQKEKSGHFLLSAMAPSCPFCPPPGPADLMEVRTSAPIAMTNEPITLTGTLHMVGDDDNGLYYRLADATLQPGS
ncbi:DUF3299 domain-containing protein [Nitrospirillum sp. BR 11828]|uniref:DUF3299 domain-containing protein n=1 Tax=Nitrospirillum sp. BR 11828 TaxID=3104325 RepID=UPI002ACA7F6C|nr:DUF3299 domain-containing protein [Nitrospirillum sp. BR 11828]MDZ5647010.1 DUF3299 domain-containing protein [Nitrospirillum sp. BR 11828]